MAFLISACNGGGSAAGVSTDTGGDRSGDSGAAAVTIDWVAPAARADGSSLLLSDIAGYKVYYGKASGDYSNSLEIKDGTSQSTTVSVAPGLNYFVVTCLDTAGRESIYSQEFKIII